MKKFIKPLVICTALFALLPAVLGFTSWQTPAEQAASPVGEFTTIIKVEELPQDMPEGMRRALAGTWDVIFLESKRYQILLGDKPMVEGHFTVTNNEVVMTDEKGMISCSLSPGEETGKYKWTLEAGKLIFASTDDKCEGRKLILSIHPWTKKEATVAPKKKK
jgi:hypothetical protein